MLQFISEGATLIVAVCALAYTAYEVRLQRAHNRLTVRPHLARHVHRTRADGWAELRVEIVNSGLGPAFIADFQSYLDGQPCELNDAAALLLKDVNVRHSCTTLGSSNAMAANERQDILRVRFPCKSQQELEDMAFRLDRMDIKIDYECGYGSKRILDSRS